MRTKNIRTSSKISSNPKSGPCFVFLRSRALPALLCTASLWATGCGNETSSAVVVTGGMKINGYVYTGQQGVGNSSIQLYTAGTTGNGSASTPMLITPVTTDDAGAFSIAGDYACVHPTDQVYIVASGGNPGLAANTDNRALVLMAAIGPCSNLTATTSIDLNEVTTVAAVWALAPFISSAQSIGASSTNSLGIANAFLNANLLADLATGMATTLPANLKVETGKLYALANALASCSKSDGLSACAPLFAAATPAGVASPSNTLNAALNIVRYPGQNVQPVYKAITPQAPFPTLLTQSPNDWTMSMTVTGSGMDYPASLALDSFGNVWAANYGGVLSAFSPQGTPLSTTGFGIGTLNESYGVAIDPSNNIWVTNEQYPNNGNTAGSLSAFVGAGSGAMGSQLNSTQYFYDPSIDYPYSVAADTNGNILIADYGSSSTTVYNGSGQLLSSGFGDGYLSLPIAIVADATHGMWVANEGDGTVTHISPTGAILAHASCCSSPSAIALDGSGNAWVADYGGSSVCEVSSAGSVSLTGITSGGIAQGYPSSIIVDAGENVWVSNHYGETISELAGPGGSLAPGTAISPSTGYGMDAGLSLPFDIAPDASGNLWTTNTFGNTVVMFFGLATPTSTPKFAGPKAP